MKAIKYVLILGLALGFGSCSDSSLDPWKDITAGDGMMVIADEILSPVYNFTDLANAKFEYTISVPGNNAAKYELYASLNGGTTSLVKTITTFPGKVTVTAQELATALGITTGAFKAGDQVNFFATVTRNDGVVFSHKTIDGDVENPGMKDAYTFVTYFSCPFLPAEAAGTYVVTKDAWQDYAADGTEELVVEAAGDSVVIKGLYSTAWKGKANEATMPWRELNVAVKVNLTTGIASVDPRRAYHATWWGTSPAFITYGWANVDGSGFVFSCSGIITLNLQHRVNTGTFGGGPYNITLKRIR